MAKNLLGKHGKGSFQKYSASRASFADILCLNLKWRGIDDQNPSRNNKIAWDNKCQWIIYSIIEPVMDQV